MRAGRWAGLCALAAAVALAASPPARAQGNERTAASPSSGARVAVTRLQYRDGSYAADTAGIHALLAATGREPERMLADALRGAGYAVVEPDAGAMMQESPACDVDVDCAVRYGRTLGAERVVTGHVSKFSSIVWYLTLALVDVPRGRVLRTEEVELKGDAADLVPKGFIAIARRFAAGDTMMLATARAGAAYATAPARPRMSREEVVRSLAAGTDERPADLTGRDLSGLDLGGLDFRRADLSRSILDGARVAGAQMFGVTLNDASARGTDFTGAVLDVAVLRRTDLTRAVLRDATLYATILIGADLTEADLTGARVIAALNDARLPRAILARVRMGADPGNQPMGVMRSDLTGADLRGADLRGADLRKAKLTRADLTGARLDSADVAGADLSNAILRDVRGRATLRNLDRALNVETAIFHTPH
jgi:uncharacterized protein YjbI with pentapeptide repeats